MKQGKRFVCDTLVCTICGNKTTVPRMCDRRRARGHIKDMWCPYCQRKTKFKEILFEDAVRNFDGELLVR